MPPHSNADTPVMRQYLDAKARYPDCILFFRLGDFFEMFFEDAIYVSRALDLALTSRDKNKEDGVPMCGVPHHSARFYIGKLIELGKKVAICDQVEDARLAKGIVRRAVTQVVTPGVVLEEEQLAPKAGHYLAALCPGLGPSGSAGLSYLDVTTGEFAATQLAPSEALEELCRIAPAEVLWVTPPKDDAPTPEEILKAHAELHDRLGRRLRVPLTRATAPDPTADLALLAEVLGPLEADEEAAAGRDPQTLRPRLSGWPQAVHAAAACVRYARSAQPGGTLPLTRLRLYRPSEELVIDESTRANLELFQTSMERKTRGSLLSVLDETRTAPGGRLLRRWLGAPLQEVAAIRRRHDAVEWLVERQAVRDAARAVLADIHDLERLTGRITLGVASPRDLWVLQRSLQVMPLLQGQLGGAGPAEQALGLGSPELLSLGADLCSDVAARIGQAIADDPPAAYREGGFIRGGFCAELDELTEIARGGKEHILKIEEREKERSGIPSLKVRYNRVFGYYLEITKSNLSKVPQDYIRKQTLANAERYVTPELQEYEAKVLGAEDRRVSLELELFEKLRKSLEKEAPRLLGLAERVARIDALAGLAEVAHRSGYVRPEVDSGVVLDIEAGRHPVVEGLVPPGTFVPNDIQLDPDGAQLCVITGPNMAGKSTIMRQTALMCILSQMGSFVPARRARLGVVDRVFTRVGASDNLSRGESTFMVEMRETATILQGASRRSLVVLDEIGRGTSTYDGVSIAWAVAEYLHDRIGCKTLFATHYHELTTLADIRPRVRNLSVAVSEQGGEIAFLHQLVAGGTNRSYGIEVARLAGLPQAVVLRAREVLRALEAEEGGGLALPIHGRVAQSGQLGLFGAPQEPERPTRGRKAAASAGAAAAGQGGAAVHLVPPMDPREADVLRRLREADPDGMTPRDALMFMATLQQTLKSGRS